MTAPVVWIAAVLAIPALVAAATHTRLSPERLRAVAASGAAALLAVASLVFFVPGLGAWRIEMPPGLGPAAGETLLRIDGFSSVLPAFAAGLWLLTVAVTPRTLLGRGGLRRAALATVLTTLSFLTESPLLLVVLWAASVVTFLQALAGTEGIRARRAAGLYLGASTVLLAAGVAIVAWPGAHSAAAEAAGLWLVVAAALIRKGIVPFHAWMPAAFEHGRLGPAVLFSSPQLGTYVVIVLVVPHAPVEMLRAVAVLALVTAAYGAALAVVQRSARRACGYLFMSQSALVLAGLGGAGEESLAGALVLWLSSGLAFAGLARCVLVLEARRGPLDLTTYHGGFERMPQLAGSFLLMGLSCIGFPGTLGFVGEELLIAGAVGSFPVLGYLVVASGALTGVAILRMYFSLFCGRRDDSAHLRIRRREWIAFGSVVAFLVVTGVAPLRVVSSRLDASRHLLETRADHGAAAQAGLRTPGVPPAYGGGTLTSNDTHIERDQTR